MMNASIFSRFNNLLGAFRRADSGNVAVMFGIAIVPMLGLVGAAVDYARANNARSSMQAALDTAALMLSKDAAGLTSDQRFEAWVSAMQGAATARERPPAAAEGVTVTGKDGASLGTVRLQKGKLSFQSSARHADFAAWLHDNADALFPRLHEEFLARSIPSE